jgi:flagellar biosynthesis chaperone FliJ
MRLFENQVILLLLLLLLLIELSQAEVEAKVEVEAKEEDNQLIFPFVNNDQSIENKITFLNSNNNNINNDDNNNNNNNNKHKNSFIRRIELDDIIDTLDTINFYLEQNSIQMERLNKCKTKLSTLHNEASRESFNDWIQMFQLSIKDSINQMSDDTNNHNNNNNDYSNYMRFSQLLQMLNKHEHTKYNNNNNNNDSFFHNKITMSTDQMTIQVRNNLKMFFQ